MNGKIIKVKYAKNQTSSISHPLLGGHAMMMSVDSVYGDASILKVYLQSQCMKATHLLEANHGCGGASCRRERKEKE